jgi:hypothetical protein
MFPKTKARETLDSRESKTNYFPREQTLSVLLYSDEQKINIQQHSYNNCISWRKLYSVNEFKIKRTYT